MVSCQKGIIHLSIITIYALVFAGNPSIILLFFSVDGDNSSWSSLWTFLFRQVKPYSHNSYPPFHDMFHKNNDSQVKMQKVLIFIVAL